MDNDKLEFYRVVIDDLNTLMVDIHCRLQEENLNLKELQIIQLELKNAKTIVDTLLMIFNMSLKVSSHLLKFKNKSLSKSVQNVFSDTIIQLNIITGNIARKQKLLSKRLCEYAYGKTKNEGIYPLFYLANDKIIDYLYYDNETFRNADLMVKIMMVELLQKYLNSEIEDLPLLLGEAKEIDKDAHFSFGKNLQLLNEFLNGEQEQELVKYLKKRNNN